LSRSVIALLDRADQDQVRTDLRTFFGPHADVYLRAYEKMRGATGGRRLPVLGWSWPAALAGAIWFFYRKMYAVGTVALVLSIALDQVLDIGSVVIALLLAIYGKGFYVDAALRRVAKADELGLIGAERDGYLRAAGGVSVAAGAVAILVYTAVLAYSIVDLIDIVDIDALLLQ
jgi:hypothetical protein